MTDPQNPALAAKDIQLFRASNGSLILQLRDLSFEDVQVVRAAPLSQPDRYICFLSSDGQEIGMVNDISAFSAEERSVVEDELTKRHIVTCIRTMLSVRREADVLYFRAETNRGQRDLVVRNAEENIRWINNHRLLITDVYGGRFEVPDAGRLDEESKTIFSEMFR